MATIPLGKAARSPRCIPSRRRLARGRRPSVEAMEPRIVMDGSPRFIGSDPNNLIEISLVSPTEQWTIVDGIYKSNAPVAIGLKPTSASFTPVLILGDELGTPGSFGIEIDGANNRFTIKATPTDHNVLTYQPGNNASKAANLFEFVGDFKVQAETLLAAPGLTPSGLVLATDPDSTIGIKVDNGGVLAPSTLQLTRGADLNKTPEIVMTGPMTISADSKFNVAKKLLEKLKISISNDASANVTADASGKVTLVSQTGSAILITLNEGDTFTLGPVQVMSKSGQVSYDTTAKTLSISGQFTVGLKDDGADVTPFLLDFGDTNRPGIVLDFADGGFAVDSVYVAVQAGTKDGQTRSTLDLSGLQVAVNNLFFLYDRKADEIGVGGKVSVAFGEKSDAGQPTSNATLTLGNATQDPATSKAGLFIKDGKVDSFSGEFAGTFKIRRVTIKADVSASYSATATPPDTGSAASIFGTLQLIVNNPLNAQTFALTATVPAAAPLLYKDGDWILQGISFTVNGEIDLPGGLDIDPQSLKIGFGDRPDPNNAQKTQRVVTVSGGVTLPKLWNATVSFNDGVNPGLLIVDGAVELDGFQFSIDRTTIGGGIGLLAFSLDFQRLNNGADWDLKLAGKVVLPGGIELDASIELKDGVPIELGVEYKATGSDPGIPVGDTGLFITDAGLQLDNLYSSELIVEGEIGLGYGEPVDGVRVFNCSGHFKVDRHEFDILSADFAFLNGAAGKGKGSLELNWTKHEYKATFDVSFFYQVFDISGGFDLNPFGQVTVFLDVGLRIPSWVPFVGGDHLADIDGLFYYDPIVPDNTLAAGWIDINTFIFGHLRAGLVYYPNGPNEGVHFITGSDVEKLENQSTHEDGYTTTYTPSIGTDANMSLFTFVSDTANAIGTITVTVPGVASPITLVGGSKTPVPFSANGLNYQAVLNDLNPDPGSSDPNQKHRFSFTIVADPASNRYGYLPKGMYSITTLTAEPLESTLAHVESFALPEVSNVVLAQAMNSNTVAVTVNYGTGDPASTSIDLLYATDPSATTGTKFQTISVAGLSNTGTATGTLDLSNLAVRKDYYVLARISDPTNPAVAPAISQATVTPYPTISAQLTIAPSVPYDRAADTLSGWPVVWHRTDVSGVPDIQGTTDDFGYAGLAVAAGTYTVTIAPNNWDGFTPLPAANQTANPNGQLTQTGVAVGTPGAPTAISLNYQNMISIHGLISEDLSGDGKFQPGGAGLAKLTVYSDLNDNGLLDPGEPRTTTDLGGYYDLRFPLPNVASNYTIRLVGDGQTITYLRVAPTSPTNDTFRVAVPGVSDFYPIAVNPQNPNPGEEGFAYNGRDFLLHHPIIISGVGYVAGTLGTYEPGAAPAVGKKIDLFNLDDNSTFLTTTTASDGTYSFSVPKPGNWRVSTDINDFNEVSAPGRHAFGTELVGGSLDYSVPATTPDHRPLYQLGEDASGPLVASGDFFGDGVLSTATLAVDSADWSATKAADLYVVIYKGSDLPSKVTAQAFPVEQGLLKNLDAIPSLYWSDALLSFVMPTPKPQGGVIARSLFPLTGLVETTSIATNAVVPAGPNSPAAPMTTLLGVTSTAMNETHAWLMASDSGREWMLLQYSDLDGQPDVLASFNFFTSDGVRPDLSRHIDADGSLAGRWAAITNGEFDGDGVPDYAFSAVDAAGNQRVAYLLSKENYSSVHTLQLAGAYRVSPDAPAVGQVFINSISAVPLNTSAGPGALDRLAVHRSAVIGSGASAKSLNEMIFFTPIPTPDAQIVAGGRNQSVSFAFQSIYPLQGGFSDDVVTDINADNFPDVLFLDDQVLGVMLGHGDGRFDAPVYSTLGAGLRAGASGGLLSAGTFAAPVPCNALPSLLYVQQSQAGSPLSLQLIYNSSTFSNSYLFHVESASSTGGYNFGFASSTGAVPDTYTGSVFVDSNANGKQDPGEPGIPNRTVQVVTYGLFGPNEPVFYKTGPDGRYSIPDTQQEVEISVPGFNPRTTSPATNNGAYDITRAGGVTGYDFGVMYAVSDVGTLQGIVYLASAPDGSYTPGDPGLGGITVFLDVNGTGQLDAGDKQTITDSHGAYQIGGLTTGTYIVLQNLPTGVKQVAGPTSVDVIGGQTTYAANFGDTKSNLALDFNNDGQPDYVRLVDVDAHHTRVEIDVMAAGAVGRTQVVGVYDPTARRPVGVADFDRDGSLDLLFQDQGGGHVTFWSLRYGEFVADRALTTLPENARVVAVADVDHKGSMDLIVRDRATNSLSAWLMDGSTNTGTRPLGRLTDEQVIEGSADVNGDRQPDLLIRNSRTGEISARLLDDGAVLRELVVGRPATSSSLVGVEPSVDGLSRLYWQDEATGQITSWLYEPGVGKIGESQSSSLSRGTHEGRYLSLRAADTPLLVSIADRAVAQGTPVAFTVGRNAAAGTRSLAYSLAQGAPAGATIDPTTGAFAWTPPANLAPGAYSITVIAEAPASPGLTDARSFTVTVTAAAPSAPTPAQYVGAVFEVVLGRTASPAEAASYAARLDSGASRADVVQAILGSPEARGLQADAIYRTYLERPAAGRERNRAIATLNSPGGEDALILSLVTSREYLRANPTARAFVTSLYREALGRRPSRSELAGWVRATSRPKIARSVLNSAEARGRVVDRDYATILLRPATPGERASWVQSLRGGRASRDDLRRSLLSSDEFFQRAGTAQP